MEKVGSFLQVFDYSSWLCCWSLSADRVFDHGFCLTGLHTHQTSFGEPVAERDVVDGEIISDGEWLGSMAKLVGRKLSPSAQRPLFR